MSMRAVFYEANGPARDVLRVGEMPVPSPAAGEVRVKIAVSAVNPVDVKRRRGLRGGMEFPRIVPHFDGAGVVDAVGTGVPASRLGERVWVYEARWRRAIGTAAEYTTVPAARAVPLPAGIGFEVGACLGIPALTAHRCVFADGPVEGRTVLVSGGAGVVGGYAVQFAKLGGARVIATVSSAAKAEIARANGADDIVNYRLQDVGARVEALTAGTGVDRIVEVELGGNLEAALQAAAANATIAVYASDAAPEPVLPAYRLIYRNLALRFVLVFSMPEDAKRRAIDDLGRWLEAGRLRHPIGPHFELDEAAAAHDAQEAGGAGKVLIGTGAPM